MKHNWYGVFICRTCGAQVENEGDIEEAEKKGCPGIKKGGEKDEQM